MNLFIAHCISLVYDRLVRKYSSELVNRIRRLRSFGKTYSEIRDELGINIPKSTFSDLCSGVDLPKEYSDRIAKLNVDNLSKGRCIAVEFYRLRREKFLKDLDKINEPISKEVVNLIPAKIALAMLCLGEASKYNPKTRRTFSLGNSDPRIVIIFLELIKKCFPFSIEKLRCTVQCRADQNIEELEKFWMETTRIPKRLFYKARIDPRTIGKPTKKTDYKGVLRIDYFDTKVQLELESLSKLIYNEVSKGPVV